MTEHGKVDIMESGESEADHKKKDDLRQKCDEVQPNVIIFHSQIQQVKIHTKIRSNYFIDFQCLDRSSPEIVSYVFSCNVIEICVFQELVSI